MSKTMGKKPKTRLATNDRVIYLLLVCREIDNILSNRKLDNKVKLLLCFMFIDLVVSHHLFDGRAISPHIGTLENRLKGIGVTSPADRARVVERAAREVNLMVKRISKPEKKKK